MSKYLNEYGWEPVIYTPENPAFGTIDKSLESEVANNIEVIRLPIWEPYQFFKFIKGKKGGLTASDIAITDKKKGIFDKLALWIRSNLFIPDPRHFWVQPSVKFLPDIIKSNNIQAIITTGPPHSMHLIGKQLKKKTDIKWIADFRDPWTRWDLYESLPMTGIVWKLHKKMEKNVLQQADAVLTINHHYKKDFEKISGREVQVVSNGYDESDFNNFQKATTEIFTIRYVGIVDEMRNPYSFFEALEKFLKEVPDAILKVEFIGNVTADIKMHVQDNDTLNDIIELVPYQPHEKIIKLYETTDLLLLILTNSKHAISNIPGKIYEYLASGANVLAVGPEESEVSIILNETKAGKIADFDDIDKIKEIVKNYYVSYQNGIDVEPRNVKSYTRKFQAGKVAEILDALNTEPST